MYSRYFKRLFDVLCAATAIIVFSWLYILIAILVRIRLGNPVLFTQKRPGKNEKLFTLLKFRTMTDERDENGELLPDDVRLTKFGKWLRSTSLDEIPEALNILKGDMSVIGPRPQLVKDMVFMTDEQRRRHTVRPGLSGLAQINGRNAAGWDKKLWCDLEYINRGITFKGDIKIIFLTVMKVFVKREGINEQGMETATDYGDYLLSIGRAGIVEYEEKQREARKLLGITTDETMTKKTFSSNI